MDVMDLNPPICKITSFDPPIVSSLHYPIHQAPCAVEPNTQRYPFDPNLFRPFLYQWSGRRENILVGGILSSRCTGFLYKKKTENKFLERKQSIADFPITGSHLPSWRWNPASIHSPYLLPKGRGSSQKHMESQRYLWCKHSPSSWLLAIFFTPFVIWPMSQSTNYHLFELYLWSLAFKTYVWWVTPDFLLKITLLSPVTQRRSNPTRPQRQMQRTPRLRPMSQTACNWQLTHYLEAISNHPKVGIYPINYYYIVFLFDLLGISLLEYIIGFGIGLIPLLQTPIGDAFLWK